MDAKRVKRIVITKSRFDLRHKNEADERSNHAQDDRAERAGVASGRGHGDETGNDAGAEAQCRSLVTRQAFYEHPG